MFLWIINYRNRLPKHCPRQFDRWLRKVLGRRIPCKWGRKTVLLPQQKEETPVCRNHAINEISHFWNPPWPGWRLRGVLLDWTQSASALVQGQLLRASVSGIFCVASRYSSEFWIASSRFFASMIRHDMIIVHDASLQKLTVKPAMRKKWVWKRLNWTEKFASINFKRASSKVEYKLPALIFKLRKMWVENA